MEVTLQYYRRENLEDDIINDTFEVIDEVHNCLELFNSLEDTLTVSWHTMYLKAKKYYEEYGNLLIPVSYMSKDGYGLGRWFQVEILGC